MMSEEATVHHGQHLFGQITASVPDDVGKQGIPQVEQTFSEMHRVTKAYLEILVDGLDVGALHPNFRQKKFYRNDPCPSYGNHIVTTYKLSLGLRNCQFLRGKILSCEDGFSEPAWQGRSEPIDQVEQGRRHQAQPQNQDEDRGAG